MLMSYSDEIPEIIAMTTLFGRYFQIRDDLKNLTSEEVTTPHPRAKLDDTLLRTRILSSIQPKKASVKTWTKANTPSP